MGGDHSRKKEQYKDTVNWERPEAEFSHSGNPEGEGAGGGWSGCYQIPQTHLTPTGEWPPPPRTWASRPKSCISPHGHPCIQAGARG